MSNQKCASSIQLISKLEENNKINLEVTNKGMEYLNQLSPSIFQYNFLLKKIYQ